MTVYFDKKNERWIYDFWKFNRRYSGVCYDDDGNHIRTRTAAKDYEAAVKVSIKKNIKKQHRHVPAGSYTLAQAMDVYVRRVIKHKNWSNIKEYIAEILAYFKPDTPVIDITEEDVWDYIEESRQKKIQIYIGGPVAKSKNSKAWKEIDKTRTDATINRYLTTFRAAMYLAHKTRDPITRELMLPIMLGIPHLKEMARLPRPILEADLKKIIASAPPYLADAIRLTVHMGFRKTEVFNLRRHQFDRENRGVWLKGEETKGKRDEFIEANSFAFEILDRLDREAEAREDDYLLVYVPRNRPNAKPVPIKNPKRAWKTVLKSLDLVGRYTFHNTKAAFLSAVAGNTGGKVVQSLGRHKDGKTTERYVAVANEDRRRAVEAIADRMGTDESPNKSPNKTGRR